MSPTSTCIRTCRTTNGSAPVKPPWKSWFVRWSDPGAPPHPVVPPGSLFDSVLQARPEAGLGRLTVCDTTLWTSVFGGLEGLHVFWKNVITAQAR